MIFKWWNWLLAPVMLYEGEPGGGSTDAGTGGDGAAETTTTTTGTDAGTTGADDQGGEGAGGEGGEAGKPKSMLEAIEQTLDKKNLEGGESGQQPAKKVATGEDPNKKAQPKAGEKPGDKDDIYKVPDGLSEPANRRFQKLIGTLKERDKQIENHDAAIREREDTIGGFRTLFEENRVTAEDFDSLLTYNRLCKTGNYDDALKLLQGQMRLLSVAMGKPLDGVDLLGEFPDLKADLAAMRITEDRAHEIARSRVAQRESQNVNQRQQQQRTQDQQQEDRARAYNDAKSKALESVEAFALEMSGKDIDYPAKEERINARMEWLAKNVHPRLWLEHIKTMYEMAGPINAKTPTNGGEQPLRTNGGAGGLKPQPKSMLEAIDQTLGYT